MGCLKIIDIDSAMRVIAIIPARGGSKGVPGKNLLPVGGIPLIGRTVLSAKTAHFVDDVYCSSDDKDILDVARQYGAKSIHRPVDLASDTSTSESALIHALEIIHADGAEADILVFLQCTSPFTTNRDIDALIEALDNRDFACAMLVTHNHGFIWRTDSSGKGVGVNHDHTQPRKRRQDLEIEYKETGAGYAMRVPDFLKTQNRFCGPLALVPSDTPDVEIDTVDDVIIVNAIADQDEKKPGKPDLRGVKALITDFDGVHTDDKVILNQNGVESVRCSRSDGLGIEQLKETGIPVLILSRERNEVVRRRAEKLGVDVIHGAMDKVTILEHWIGERGLAWDDIAYVGNDLNDLECLKRVGFPFVPSDAHASVMHSTFGVLSNSGGEGAVREVCDAILAFNVLGDGAPVTNKVVE